MKKLWLIEVWYQIRKQGSAKLFFVGLRKFPAFTVFVFFSSFSYLIHLKTVTKHSSVRLRFKTKHINIFYLNISVLTNRTQN